jgi:hypothetical protein
LLSSVNHYFASINGGFLKIVVPCGTPKTSSILPSGKLTYVTMENHHFQWVNQLFLWPFSIGYVKLPEGSGISHENHYPAIGVAPLEHREPSRSGQEASAYVYESFLGALSFKLASRRM